MTELLELVCMSPVLRELTAAEFISLKRFLANPNPELEPWCSDWTDDRLDSARAALLLGKVLGCPHWRGYQLLETVFYDARQENSTIYNWSIIRRELRIAAKAE